MKRITLTFMILLSVFFTIWGVKMKHPINRPENVKEDTETPWYETKYQAPKADDEWTLDPEIPLNYIPVPGEDELYMVVDDSGNITNYRKRVKQADGSWVWQDVNPDIPDNYEKVDGLDNVYKVTNKDGTTEYKQYVRKDANPFVIVYRTNDPATYGKAFTCFSEKTVKIEQSCIFDYKDALAKIEPNIIRSWQYTHTRTDIDFSYPARSINLKQKCKITLGTRLSFSDIGECAFRLQNCIFTNGGTILLPQEASRKKSNKLSPEGIVKDYNSQCYMKFDKIMEQLKSYGTIPVTDMQQSVWNILEKLKFSSAFGFSNTRDLQKNYLSTFEKEGDALDVVIKILKIPGVLQRNYPGTTHDRVNECIGKIFNLKMEKLIV